MYTTPLTQEELLNRICRKLDDFRNNLDVTRKAVAHFIRQCGHFLDRGYGYVKSDGYVKAVDYYFGGYWTLFNEFLSFLVNSSVIILQVFY